MIMAKLMSLLSLGLSLFNSLSVFLSVILQVRDLVFVPVSLCLYLSIALSLRMTLRVCIWILIWFYFSSKFINITISHAPGYQGQYTSSLILAMRIARPQFKYSNPLKIKSIDFSSHGLIIPAYE